MELLLMLLLVWLCGCDRKWPMNGALDGQWQLLTVETRADGVVTDRKDEQLYFRFQLQLMMLTDLGGRFRNRRDSGAVGPFWIG